MLEKFSFDNESVFFKVISQGSYDDVKNFFNANPDMINQKDKNSYTPVAITVATERVDIYKYLRDKKANLDLKYSQDGMEDISILHMAVASGSFEMVKILLKDGANVNSVIKNTRILPISLAVENSHFELAKYLINHDSMPHLEFPVPFLMRVKNQ